MEKNDAQINRVAVVKRAPSPLKKCFRKKILSAYLCRPGLQNCVRKFFLNKGVSRYLTFADFLVPKNWPSTSSY